jgi:hypothetical protein
MCCRYYANSKMPFYKRDWSSCRWRGILEWMTDVHYWAQLLVEMGGLELFIQAGLEPCSSLSLPLLSSWNIGMSHQAWPRKNSFWKTWEKGDKRWQIFVPTTDPLWSVGKSLAVFECSQFPIKWTRTPSQLWAGPPCTPEVWFTS